MDKSAMDLLSQLEKNPADGKLLIKAVFKLLENKQPSLAHELIQRFSSQSNLDQQLVYDLLQQVERKMMASKPANFKFSFIYITLNGMPFLEFSLKSIYEFAHEIIIVEGAVEKCLFAANPDGSSNDGTVEMIRTFPDPEKKIKLIQGIWPEKNEMTNAGLEQVTGDYIWLMADDQLFKKDHIQRLIDIVKEDPSITQVNVMQDNFWKGFDYIYYSPKFEKAVYQQQHIFKYMPGCYFEQHRPPKMNYPGFLMNSEQLHCIEGHKIREQGITSFHYSHVLDNQVYQKMQLYKRYGWGEKWGFDIDDWYENCFQAWTPGNSKKIESKYPVWSCDKNSRTVPFKGEHPEVMKDYIKKFTPSYKQKDSVSVHTKINTGKKLNIVHLSTHDYGGAGKAAYRFHKGMLAAGHDSVMLVLNKKTNDPTVKALSEQTVVGKSQVWDKYIERMRVKWADYPNKKPSFEFFSDSFSEINLKQIPEIQQADVINLHWIAGLANMIDLNELSANKKICWTLHDMNAFTGGCHYADDCTRYQQTCGQCPKLGSKCKNDISHDIWQDRHQLYQSIDVNIITPSKWLSDSANKSSLLNDKSITTIANGIDLEVFKPQDKAMARRLLNIPETANVVLFGAESILKKRKGLEYLFRSLDYMWRKNLEKDMILAVFGKLGPNQTIETCYPLIHFDTIEDETKLALLYSAADVFVIPSVQDNLPNTVVESLACGTPVAGFDAGGIGGMIDHKRTGYIASATNTIELAKGIHWLLKAKRNGLDLAGFCREKAMNDYNLKTQVNRYLELYTGKQHMPLETSRSKDINTIVATSLSPKMIELQKQTLQSWKRVGLKVISVNTQQEIQSLSCQYPEVDFVPVIRHAGNLVGKPLVYIDDIIIALKQYDADVYGIINSDIHLITDEDLIPFIQQQSQNALVFGNRINIDSLDNLSGKIHERGFDYFFFDKSVLDGFKTSDLCLGAAWWDYWLPLNTALNGHSVRRLTTPLAYHVNHDLRWDKSQWMLLGECFYAAIEKHAQQWGSDSNQADNPWQFFWDTLNEQVVIHTPELQAKFSDPDLRKEKLCNLKSHFVYHFLKAQVEDVGCSLQLQESSPSENKQITIFAIPKPFKGHERVIQRNAIQSWLNLSPRPEIILMGNEEGVKETAEEFGLIHKANIQCHRTGTPLISDAFHQAEQHSHNQVLVYLNCDMILMQDFMEALEKTRTKFNEFLMLGRRWDAEIQHEIDYSQQNWQQQIKQIVNQTAILHGPAGKDYFAFSRGLWNQIPPFMVGRPSWDDWMAYEVMKQAKPVIDATNAVMAIHQNHDYGHLPDGANTKDAPDTLYNRNLANKESHLGHSHQAPWIFKAGSIQRRSKQELLKNRLDLSVVDLIEKTWPQQRIPEQKKTEIIPVVGQSSRNSKQQQSIIRTLKPAPPYERIYHYHIRKTGGTSINHMFLSLAGEDSSKVYERLSSRESRGNRTTLSNGIRFAGWEKKVIDEGDYLYAFSHIPHHQLSLPQNTFTFTCLRDPIDRLLSYYKMLNHYKTNNIDHVGMLEQHHYLGSSLNDFLQRTPKEMMLNQLYMFSDRFDVNEAYENIKNCSCYFFTEDFENGVNDLSQKIQIPLQAIHKRKAKDQLELSSSDRSQLQSLLEPEYELISRLRKDRYRSEQAAKIKQDLVMQVIGSEYGGWALDLNLVPKGSTVISAGVGEDISFDLELIKKRNCRVIGIDPTPKSQRYIEQQQPVNFEFIPMALTAVSGQEIKLYKNTNPNYVSESINPSHKSVSLSDYHLAKTINVSDLLNRINNVSVLKMDIEGAEYEVLNSLQKLDVPQICVEFHHFCTEHPLEDTLDCIEHLKKLGYVLAANKNPKKPFTEVTLVHRKYLNQRSIVELESHSDVVMTC